VDFEDGPEAQPFVGPVVEVIVVGATEGNAVGDAAAELGVSAARLDVVRVEVRLRATVRDLAGVVVAAEHSSFPITVGSALVVIIHHFFLSVVQRVSIHQTDALVRNACVAVGRRVVSLAVKPRCQGGTKDCEATVGGANATCFVVSLTPLPRRGRAPQEIVSCQFLRSTEASCVSWGVRESRSGSGRHH
jgi:hypothetical protein